MVSIIVPVYNAEKYLEKCIQSLIRQSYRKIEIILINDGSTDGSLKICEKYHKADRRIRIIDKNNEGQGIARNTGIAHARGEELMFVDADDWVIPECVQELADAMNQNQADVVIGNLYKTQFEKEEILTVLEEEVNTSILEGENKKEFLFRISTYPVSKLFKKILFEQFEISFPKHFFEDVSTLPLVYAVSKKICFVDKALYYYRNHESSTVNNVKNIYDRIVCLNTLVENFKRVSLYENYADKIRDYILIRSQINLRVVKMLSDRILNQFIEAQNRFLTEKIDLTEVKFPKVYVFGSYNLMIVSKLLMGIENTAEVENYFGNQNIISLMDTSNLSLNKIKVIHPNKFRCRGMMQDFSKRLAMLNPGEFHEIDYFLIDFLEERYPVGIYKGDYFTVSDAFLDIKDDMGMKFQMIVSFSEAWKELWREKCKEFIGLLKRYVSANRIVLVKMKLSEKYGSSKLKYFPDKEEIERINEELENCYQYFCRLCPEAKVIEVEGQEEYYTAENFRHGCFPWHLNASAYNGICKKIERQLE